MKTDMNEKAINISEVLEDYQIPDFQFFDDYLSEIFIDLVEKSQKNLQAIEKYVFSKYIDTYGIILDRLFKIFDRDGDGLLNRVEFILGMKKLYSQCTSFKSLSKLIFKIYDFDQDGKISKDDVKLILSHVFLSNSDKFGEIFENINQLQNILKKIIDFSFQKKNEMDFNNFCYVIENKCSDIFIPILMFLLEKRPFNDETIFVYMLGKNISPNLSDSSTKDSNLEIKTIKSPILNFKSIVNFHLKKKFNLNKYLADNKSFDLDVIDDKTKENIIFHEGLIFKGSKDENNKIKKVKKIFFRIVGKDLYYYKKSDLRNHKGINNLSCTFVQEGEEVIINDVIYFSIVINYYKKEKIYYFDTEESRNIWLEKFREATGQKNIKNKYKISKQNIGEGSFSSVKYGTNIKTKESVAVKIISKKNMDKNDLESVMNEIYAMKICKFFYIIKLYDIYETNNHIYIVMEHCKNGNLFNYFKDDIYELHEDIAKIIIYKLLLSINYIHSLGIIHRDIKLCNILFFDESKVNIRLIDFGLCKILGPSEKAKECCGTLSFAAPELLKEIPYSKSVDFWGIGIITFFLLSGYLPFDDKNTEKVFRKIIEDPIYFKESIWKNISVEAKDFVSGLLEKNPEKRFNIEQALEHPWVNSLNQNKEIMI